MIICKECGNAAPSRDGFCSSCGVLLEWSGQQVEPQPAPPPIPATSGSVWSPSTLAPMPTPLPPTLPARTPDASSATLPPPTGLRPDDEAVRPAPVQIATDPQYTGLFCSSCGTRNADGRAFCRYCGQPLDLTVAVPVRLRWWQRLFRRRPKAAPAAGERPRDFRRRERASGGGHALAKKRRFHLPSRLPLSKFAPILIVLGLVGVGIGPGRQWITQKFGNVVGQAKQHVDAKYVPVVPISAAASSSATGHKPALVVDGVKDTWWQSADHPDGIGESVTVRFAHPVDLDRVGLLSGVAGDKYRSQPRARTMNVTADGKPAGQVSFDDKADFQNTGVKLRGVTTVTLVVTAAYPGQQGHAVAIRELQFFARG